MILLEIIFIIIFWTSLTAIIIMLLSKIPSLLELPFSKEINRKGFIVNKIRNLNPWKNFSYRKFLAKLLLRFKILNLKLENITSHWIEKLRRGAKRKESDFPEEYWNKLKDIDSQKEDSKLNP